MWRDTLLMTADATIVLPGRGHVSKESFKAFVTALRGAFPDWYSTLEELIAEDDRVGITSGKIAEFRGLFDGLSMLHQLGAMPNQR